MNALDLARWILAAWFLFLGAAIGSFLNVVIYRVPAGLNIAWPGSHCPFCKHAIRWYDNLPILGWLMLRGRCRDCQTPISMRYPIVEAVTAGVFFLLAWSELLRHESAGLILGPSDLRGPAVIRFVVCLMHCGLMATLLAAAAIVADGGSVLWKVFAPIFVLGMALPAVWPELRPVPASPLIASNTYRGAIDGALGLCAAAALSATAFVILRRKRAVLDGFFAGSLCVGVVLGWQAIVVTAPTSVVVDTLLAGVAPRLWGAAPAARRAPSVACKRGSAVAVLGITTLAWIVAWAMIASLPAVHWLST